MVRKLGPGSVVLFGLLLSLGSGRLSAHQSVPTYGVDSPSIAVVSAWDMGVRNSQTTWSMAGANFYRYLTNSGQLMAAIHVPAGARLLSMELDACDTTATDQVAALLVRLEAAATPTALAAVTTGDAATPGCSRFSADLISGPETVDNNQFQYLVTVQSASDETTLIGAIRVVYELQVSPAPAVPTFNDVPTSDPAFQYIEALVASGITAGCGGGNYCPDATLTRRQMAVFLSKALGLHWNEQPDN